MIAFQSAKSQPKNHISIQKSAHVPLAGKNLEFRRGDGVGGSFVAGWCTPLETSFDIASDLCFAVEPELIPTMKTKCQSSPIDGAKENTGHRM